MTKILVKGIKLAVCLKLGRSRITQMRQEGKIKYANKKRKLYDLKQARQDYLSNSCPGKVLRHMADKIDHWGTYRVKPSR